MKQDISFIHTGDIHLGAKFINLGTRGSEQRQQLRETFIKIIDQAISRDVDFVILAGDTFDSNRPSPESVEVFKKAVQRLNNKSIPLLVIAGTHDPLNENSILKELAFLLNNQFVLLTPEAPIWEHPTKSLTVSGISLQDAASPANPVSCILNSANEGWHVGIVHAAMDLGHGTNEAMISKSELVASKVDYLAVGHWHNTQELNRSTPTCWYCGSPEMIAVDEQGQGNILHVSLRDGKETEVEKITVGVRKVIKLEFEAASGDHLLERIIPQADSDAIANIVIKGILPTDVQLDSEDLIQRLQPYFFHSVVSNKSTREMSDEEMLGYAGTTVIGRYVHLLQKQIEHAEGDHKRKLEEALQLGLAMLKGHEVAPWL